MQIDKSEIARRIEDWENQINRDARYSRPEFRVPAEQALATWVMALKLSEIVEELANTNLLSRIVEAGRGDPRGT